MDSWAMGIGDELGVVGFGGNCPTEIRKLRFSFQFPMETIEPKGKDRQLDTLSSTRPVSQSTVPRADQRGRPDGRGLTGNGKAFRDES